MFLFCGGHLSLVLTKIFVEIFWIKNTSFWNDLAPGGSVVTSMVNIKVVLLYCFSKSIHYVITCKRDSDRGKYDFTQLICIWHLSLVLREIFLEIIVIKNSSFLE